MNELATYEVLDADGQCVNTVLWDGSTPYDIPEGFTLRLVET
jgi:hypothetical protein